MINEMVSAGDAEISLHIRDPRNSGVGGYSGVVKTQGAKFWPNFNWGGGDSGVVKTKCQVWQNLNGGGGVF